MNKKWVKGILSPLVFVGGTTEAIVKGAANILNAGGETISSTLTNGAHRVVQLWDEKNDSDQPLADNKDATSVVSSQTQSTDPSKTQGTDPFDTLNSSINKTLGSRKLIDNAEQIRALIRDGALLGVDSMVIHCTKELGGEIKGGLVIPNNTLGLSISGHDDGTVFVEVKFK